MEGMTGIGHSASRLAGRVVGSSLGRGGTARGVSVPTASDDGGRVQSLRPATEGPPIVTPAMGRVGAVGDDSAVNGCCRTCGLNGWAGSFEPASWPHVNLASTRP